MPRFPATRGFTDAALATQLMGATDYFKLAGLLVAAGTNLLAQPRRSGRWQILQAMAREPEVVEHGWNTEPATPGRTSNSRYPGEL